MKNQNTNGRSGLLSGGNWIVDQVKLIDIYPQPEQLGNIRAQSQGTGGAPYNVLVDLAKTGAPFPLYGAGLVGRDALGEQILDDCRQHKIDTRNLSMTPKAPTSYTDVMTEQTHGRRTFFHARGANALWRGDDLNFTRTPRKCQSRRIISMSFGARTRRSHSSGASLLILPCFTGVALSAAYTPSTT